MTKERLMIFIDGGNLFHGAKSARINISHEKLVKFLSQDYHLIRTYYYTGINHPKLRDKDKISDEDFKKKLNKQKGFLDSLEFKHNFHVVTKPLIKNSAGKIQEKGIDVNIACDILWHGLNNNYDAFILISGDKDLLEVLRRMKDNGLRVIVANFEKCISGEVRRLADKYINLNQYKDEIKAEN